MAKENMLHLYDARNKCGACVVRQQLGREELVLGP
jgi:hypothetical protein